MHYGFCVECSDRKILLPSWKLNITAAQGLCCSHNCSDKSYKSTRVLLQCGRYHDLYLTRRWRKKHAILQVETNPKLAWGELAAWNRRRVSLLAACPSAWFRQNCAWISSPNWPFHSKAHSMSNKTLVKLGLSELKTQLKGSERKGGALQITNFLAILCLVLGKGSNNRR